MRRPWKAVATLAAALCVGMAFGVEGASANAGDLDTGFNLTGTLVTDLGGSNDFAWAAAVQSDDRLVVVGEESGNVAAIRLNTDGGLDQSFSPDAPAGKFSAPLSGAGGEIGYAATIQPDGKIVIAGTLFSSSGNRDDIVLIRLNDDGTPDQGFDGIPGNTSDGENGILQVNLGTQTYDDAYSVALDGDKIVVGGSIGLSGPDLMLARFDSTGQLDTSFDSDGWATLDLGSGEAVNALAVVAGHKVVVGGYTAGATQQVIGRFTDAGVLDATFSSDAPAGYAIYRPPGAGAAASDSVNAILKQADAKLVFAGNAAYLNNGVYDTDATLTRTDADGNFDPTFGSGGFVRTVNAGFDDGATGIAQQPDGRLLVGGFTERATFDFWIGRYLLGDGSIDTSFACPNGQRATDLGGGESGAALALTSTGRAYVVGSSGNQAAVVAYQTSPDGCPPTTTPPTSAPVASGPTGQRAAALKKCAKIRNKVKKRKCKKRARKLPV